MTISIIGEELPKHSTLKLAGLDDIPRIIKLAEKLYSESPYVVLGLDLNKVRQSLEKFIIEGGRDYLALMSQDEAGNAVGVLVAYAYEPLFSKDRMAIEVLWYLDPEFRTSNRGVEMMDAYEYWAKGVGCKVVHYGYLKGSPEGMVKLYERRKLELSEQIYQKVL